MKASSAVADLVDAWASRPPERLVQNVESLMTRLLPLCRSITGDGVRTTLKVVAETTPLQITEVPSGTAACDWTVPDEWNVRDAYVLDAAGVRVIDFRRSNLHLVSYSTPIAETMSLAELKSHLHSLPEQPDLIPYRTSYYARNWGFCVQHRRLAQLEEGEYRVVVDTSLKPGSLTYGESVLPGRVADEILLTAHVCHPSLANDNLSGIAVAAQLARLLEQLDHHYTYRFLFAPGTIGSITWLSRNPDVLPRVRAGLVLTGLGGPGKLVYKRTRHGGRLIDAAAAHTVATRDGEVRDYSPYGYDERQFNSVGFDLPVGRLSRTPHGEYPEYHTSGDDLSYASPPSVLDSLGAVMEVIDTLENDRLPRNLSPYGEPQLGKRGLYPTVGGRSASEAVMAMLWVLAYADGSESLLDIAQRSGLPFSVIRRAAEDLGGGDLLSLEPLGSEL